MPIPKGKESSVRTTAKERVYSALQQWIVDGTLLPGERLNDTELANYFSVSRTPVREALQLLNEQKLVNVVPSSGTFVAPVNKEELIHVYSLLIELQLFALQLCNGQITRNHCQQLTRLNENFRRCEQSGNAADTIQADFSFHMYFCELAGNPYLTQFSKELSIHTRRNETLYFRRTSRQEDSYLGHKRIIEALSRGSLAEAKAEMEMNWRLSIENTV